MYKKILVALDHTKADGSLLPHVTELAKLTGASLLLIHVADGWAAHWQERLDLADSEEMKVDQAYLDEVAKRLRAEGFQIEAVLAKGDPPKEIMRMARAEGCDLVAMTTHGHKFVADIFLGSTIEKVRHEIDIPLLLVRAAK